MIIGNLVSNVPPLRTVIEDVPELGKDAQIMLREFDAITASRFNDAMAEDKSAKSVKGIIFYSRLICACAVNESGERIADIKDANELARSWGFELISRIGNIAAELNGFTESAKADAKKHSPRSRPKQ